MKIKMTRKKIITLLCLAPFLAVILLSKQIYDGTILWNIHRNIENGSYQKREKPTTNLRVYFDDINPSLLTQYILNTNLDSAETLINLCGERKKKDMLPSLREIAQKNIVKENDDIFFYSTCAVAALEENIKLPELEPDTSTPRYNQMSDYYRYLKKMLWAWDGKSELEPLARKIAKDWKPSTSNSECEKLNGPLKPPSATNNATDLSEDGSTKKEK